MHEKASFPGLCRRTELQVQRNVEEHENIIGVVQSSPRTSTRRISARFCVPRMRVWRTLHAEGVYPYHIITPKPLPNGPMCIWRFWPRINSGIKSRSTDFNTCDALYFSAGPTESIFMKFDVGDCYENTFGRMYILLKSGKHFWAIYVKCLSAIYNRPKLSLRVESC